MHEWKTLQKEVFKHIIHGNDVMWIWWPVATCFMGTITTTLRRSLPASHLLASQPAEDLIPNIHIPVIHYTVQIIIQIVTLPLSAESLRRTFIPVPVKISPLATASLIQFSQSMDTWPWITRRIRNGFAVDLE